MPATCRPPSPREQIDNVSDFRWPCSGQFSSEIYRNPPVCSRLRRLRDAAKAAKSRAILGIGARLSLVERLLWEQLSENWFGRSASHRNRRAVMVQSLSRY